MSQPAFNPDDLDALAHSNLAARVYRALDLLASQVFAAGDALNDPVGTPVSERDVAYGIVVVKLALTRYETSSQRGGVRPIGGSWLPFIKGKSTKVLVDLIAKRLPTDELDALYDDNPDVYASLARVWHPGISTDNFLETFGRRPVQG